MNLKPKFFATAAQWRSWLEKNHAREGLGFRTNARKEVRATCC